MKSFQSNACSHEKLCWDTNETSLQSTGELLAGLLPQTGISTLPQVQQHSRWPRRHIGKHRDHLHALEPEPEKSLMLKWSFIFTGNSFHAHCNSACPSTPLAALWNRAVNFPHDISKRPFQKDVLRRVTKPEVQSLKIWRTFLCVKEKDLGGKCLQCRTGGSPVKRVPFLAQRLAPSSASNFFLPWRIP